VSGELVEGRICYLAPVAAESTRTFRLELAIPNGDGNLRAGMTAEMRLAADQITAHVLSPALLTLDDSGVVGVKSVNDRNVVEFHAVEIVGSPADGITVTGLPQELRLITVGQGFVKPGERVDAAEILPRASLTDASPDATGIETQVKR
jgi:multidrug efflux system membrane fusion protein